MIRLFVAEKPSVGRDLARILGAKKKGDIHLDGDGVRVTWCIGHLVEVATPDAHDPKWKAWDPALLPILPRSLVLEASKKTRGHLRKLTKLLRDPHVGEVINACDAGREGELIFRYVYQYSGCSKPVRRFWVSSLTAQAIRAGLSNLRPGADYDPLGAAARCRAEADWLVGMNGTRGLTAVGSTLLSVGRVQTPTLAMVVEREQAIRGFVPQPYWEVRAELKAAPGEWTARYIGPADAPDQKGPPPGAKQADGTQKEDQRGRLPSAEAARDIARALAGQTGAVTIAERDRQTVKPPPLHHLTSLQRRANKVLGFTAARTLRAAQGLYERHKLITYPRTDSRHLTRDVAQGLPGVIQALHKSPWSADARRIANTPRGHSPWKLGKRYVDDAQVGDHHAIIPTDKPPNMAALDADEKAIYEVVARRLLAVLSPPAIYARTRLVTAVAGHRLEARGRVRLEPGWEAVDPPRSQKADAKKAAEPELPPVEVGDAATVEQTHIDAKETRPPPRYSEATLLGAMERAGRSLDDAALRAAMRDVGLGTPATRASTLETLLKRDYMAREGRTLAPTPAGEALIGALPVDTLKSPKLTAEWEQRLDRIARGDADPMVFRRDIRQFVEALVAALAAAPRVKIPESAGRRRKGRGRGRRSGATRRAASKRSGSTRRSTKRSGAPRRGRSTTRAAAPTAKASPSRPAPAPSSPAAADARRAEGAWPAAAFADAQRVARPPARPAPPTPASPVGAPCPGCGQGRLIAGRRGWGCDRWRAGCGFVLWFQHDGVEIPPPVAAELLLRRRTGPFTQRDGRRVGLAVRDGALRWIFGPSD